MDNQSNKLQLFKNVGFSQNSNRVNHSFSVNKPENNKMNNSFHIKLPEIHRMSIKTRDQNELKINTMHTLRLFEFDVPRQYSHSSYLKQREDNEEIEKVNKLSKNELLHILESKRTTIMQEQKVIYIQRTYRQIQADYREKIRQQQLQQEMELQRKKNECAFRIQKRWRIVQKKLQEELMIRKAAATQVLQKFIKKRQVKMRLERERQQKLLEEQMRQHQRESAQIKIRYYWRKFKKQVLSQKNKNKNNKNAGKQTNKNQANKRGGPRNSTNAQQQVYNPKNVVSTHKSTKLQQ
ncbi:UNKNOWN [Stylonychia lemnae]|uniref:Uncharacterized protein n=1 Tax=Stylonychia lemnae TaxID=5949 RepID=A0A077ZUF4_STYLE|nr:UNKNOWN [Stylonychia lemnae]|eukprot:CDW72925.1 UNKNOWN [Stylonychia lemnae]